MKTLIEKCRCSKHFDNDMFVGIRFDNNDIEVVFPLGYNIPKEEKECRKAILTLLKTISLTNSIIRDKVDANNKFKFQFDIPIFSYFWLITDYMKNGLFHNKEKIYNKNNYGKIYWKRTIQKTNPVLSYDNFVYIDPIYEKTKNTDSNLTEIEKYCLQIALEFFEWYFGRFSISNSKFKENHIDYMISILKNELRSSFTDYKKTLIKHLLNILIGLDDKLLKSKIYSYGTFKYEIVWEKLINETFGNEDVTKHYPKAKWYLPRKSANSSELRPDTIYFDKHEKKYYILDAKYYRFCVTENIENLPKTDSIQKQITYGRYVKRNGTTGDNIYNAFILPYNSHFNGLEINKPIEYFGYSEPLWIKNFKYPYQKIALILYDTKYAIDHWKNKRTKDIDDLIEQIVKIEEQILILK